MLATVVLSAVWCLARLRTGLAGPVAWSAASLRSGLGYGLRAYLGSLFAFLVLKSDILLVKYLRGAGETGYYSIAVGPRRHPADAAERRRHGAVSAARRRLRTWRPELALARRVLA